MSPGGRSLTFDGSLAPHEPQEGRTSFSIRSLFVIFVMGFPGNTVFFQHDTTLCFVCLDKGLGSKRKAEGFSCLRS
jgi:hypothetical protein